MSGFAFWSRVKGLVSPSGAPAPGEKRLKSFVVSGSQKAPVVRYVDAVVGRVIERRQEVILRASAALPAFGGATGESLSYAAVANRLKVLAGLYPVAYPQPAEGRFTHSSHGRAFEIAAAFDDRGDGAFCRLSLVDGGGGP